MQGFVTLAPFFGVLGLVFGLVYLRTKRVIPLVVCHTLLDVAAFVGYALLAPYLSWL